MIKIVLLIVGLVTSMSASAFDVYGVSELESKKIIKKYGKDIEEFEATFDTAMSDMAAGKGGSGGTPAQKKVSQLRLELTDKLIKDNGYLFVDFQIVTYPDEKNKAYLTIEIIDKKHPERLRFINTDPSQDKKSAHPHDVIDDMLAYEVLVSNLMLEDEAANIAPCPVYHCTLGFKNPKLAPYLKTFNNAAVNEKALILNTLNHDPSAHRREAAALLIGHFQDPHEIVSVLSHHISDKDETVRNNVMRVIGATIRKAKLTDIDVTPFLDALNSPYTTDRNKALYVLFTAADHPAAKPVIAKKGGANLIAILSLQQPNNHDWAYLILKKVSNKDFGTTNLSAWRTWLSSAS